MSVSGADQFTGRRYEIAAFAFGEAPIYYEEFGGDDANGAWFLVGRGAERFSIYRGEFGYCPAPNCANNDAFDLAFGSVEHVGGFKGAPMLLGPRRVAIPAGRAVKFVRHQGHYTTRRSAEPCTASGLCG